MRILYRCDYCGYENIENKVKRHEIICTYNPYNRTCVTCANKSYWKSLDGSNSSVYSCKLKNKNDKYDPGSGDYIKLYCDDWELEETYNRYFADRNNNVT
jgi:hypothetical protein